jgi:quercetin dioxygenase-like cupin family protein
MGQPKDDVTYSLSFLKESIMKNVAIEELAENGVSTGGGAPATKHQPGSRRWYFDVGLGSVCLGGADTGGAYCLLEVSLAPGIGVPRHTHTHEDESYYVTSGELEVIVGDQVFVLKEGDILMAPRNIPHELRNSGSTTNHYLLVFSPSGFEDFVMATALPGPENAVAPTERQLKGGDPATAIKKVHELAIQYGILFG